MMKRSLTALLTFLLLISVFAVLPVSAATKAQMTVKLNGKALQFSQAPQIMNGRLLVPYRPIAEAIGAVVTYEAATKTVKVTKGGNTHLLPINGNTATLNGVSVPLETPAILVNNTTLVPVRFVSEYLGVTVNYDNATQTVSLQSNDTPGFKILTPMQGNMLHNDKVTVGVAVFNHQFADFKAQTQPKTGQGHVHVWLDTDPKDPKVAYKLINGQPVVFDNVKPGEHTLTVQLVGNDHKPVPGVVQQTLTFTTMGGGDQAAVPSVSIVSPAEGATLSGTKVDVKVMVANHDMVDFRTNSAPKSGQGHVHVWLDTDSADPKAAYKLTQGNTATFDNIKPGEHILTVQLVGNDHKPLTPAVKQVVHFTTNNAASATKTYNLDLSNYAFATTELTVEAGSKVVFTNKDDSEHTVTAKDGSYDSGLFGKGETFEHTFTKPGVYQIYCKPHTFMTATITVK